MCKKKLTKMLIGLGLLIATVSSIFGVSAIMESKSYINETTINQKEKVEMLSKETVIKEISSVAKIETLNIISDKTAKIEKKDWLNDKTKKINYTTNTKFSFDLSKISEDNIMIFDGKIVLFVSTPMTETTITNSDFKKTENGLFSFGELKLTMENVDMINKQVVTEVEKDVINQENIHKSIVELENALNNSVFNSLSRYKIEVRMVK